MSSLLLSRLQFAFVVSFHIIYPAMSIGLGAFLVLTEAMYLRTRDELYERIYRFWSVIFALGFGMGVVSGLVMSFQFGTNWAGFSKAVGPVIGPIIGMEVVFAFFLEAGFLGIMLFGWGRVGPYLHFTSTALVCLGTTISAGCIMAANSWMQTPAGAVYANGVFHVTEWRKVVLNPSYPWRFGHMLLAAYITAAFLIAGISAWYLLRRKHVLFAQRCFSMSMLAAASLLPVQLWLGDYLALEVDAKYQLPKVEAFEGFWEAQTPAAYNVIVIPDQQHQRNKIQWGIPYLGSIIVGKNLHSSIPGLGQTPRDQQPLMWLPFYGFRVMYFLGTIMFCAALYSVWLRLRHRLFTSRAYLRLMVFLLPSGFVCVLGGWITAETGRQPWVVYGILRTANSVSPVSAHSVLTSLVMFIAVYGVLLVGFLALMTRVLRKGPIEFPLLHAPSGTVRRVFVHDGALNSR